MDNNKIKAKEQQAPSISSKSTIAQQGTTSAANAIDKLKEYGGFTFLENIIDGFSNLNPTRKARRNISSLMHNGRMNVRFLPIVLRFGLIF